MKTTTEDRSLITGHRRGWRQIVLLAGLAGVWPGCGDGSAPAPGAPPSTAAVTAPAAAAAEPPPLVPAVAAAGAVSARPARLYLEIRGDRLTLEARGVPLQEVLFRLRHHCALDPPAPAGAPAPPAGLLDLELRNVALAEGFALLLQQPPRPVPAGAAGRLCVYERLPSPAETLQLALGSGSALRRAAAVAALPRHEASLGSAADAWLAALLTDPHPLVRDSALEAVTQLAPAKALDHLVASARSPDPWTRQDALLALGDAGGPRAFAALRLALDDPHPDVRRLARDVLLELQARPP